MCTASAMKTALFAAVLSVILRDVKTQSNSTLCPFPAIPHGVTAAINQNQNVPLNWENRASLMQLLGPGTKVDLWCRYSTVFLDENSWTRYIYCKEDGTWDELPSRCYGQYSWKDENLPLEGIRQNCETGLESSSDWTRTHLANIHFLDIDKCSDTEIESVSISGSECHQEGDSSLWTCDAKSTGPSEVVIRFNSTGKLNDVIAYYTDGFCGYPPVPPYGDVIEPMGGTWDPAKTLQVSYKCNDGYELIGEDTNQCDTKTGQWNTALPECQLKPVTPRLSYDDLCGYPPVPAYGDVIEPEVDTWDPVRALQVNYTCYEGYELIGEGVNQCDPKTGQWNSDAPTCLQTVETSTLEDVREESIDFIFCGQPPVVEHGSLIETQTLNSFNSSEILKVSYKCASGYELIGNETIDCDIQSGRWNSDAPTCHQTVESSPLEEVREESGDSNLASWIGGTVGMLATVPALGYLVYLARRELRFRRTIPSTNAAVNLRDADLPVDDDGSLGV